MGNEAIAFHEKHQIFQHIDKYSKCVHVVHVIEVANFEKQQLTNVNIFQRLCLSLDQFFSKFSMYSKRKKNTKISDYTPKSFQNINKLKY